MKYETIFVTQLWELNYTNDSERSKGMDAAVEGRQSEFASLLNTRICQPHHSLGTRAHSEKK